MAQCMYTVLSGLTAPDINGKVFPTGAYVILDDTDAVISHNEALVGDIAIQFADSWGVAQVKFAATCRTDAGIFNADTVYMNGIPA